MPSRPIAAASLLVLGLAGCSSSPSPAPAPSAGALPSGTAKVAVNDNDVGTTHMVACQTLGSLTTITIGNPTAGITALVDNASTLTARSVTVNNLGGFTGSYWQDLQGSAQVGMVDQTYAFDGTASGFDTDKPSAITTGTFRIKVAC